jgi:sugar phosphate isomerase/epimerase
MRIAISTWSCRSLFRDGRLTPADFPAFVRDRFGVDAAEYNDFFFPTRPVPELDLEAVRQAGDAAGVAAVAWSVGGSFIDHNPARRRENLALAKVQIRCAAHLGAGFCRIDLGRFEDESRYATDGVQRCIEAYRELIPLAAEKRVRLCIENHGGLSGNPDHVRRIREAVGPEHVGYMLDLGNFTPDQDRYGLIEQMAPACFVLHAKTHNFTADGEERDIDYARCFGILKDAGFDGICTVEFEGDGEQVDGTKKTVELIRRHA